MTAEVWFYHLERQSVDAVLPALLEKCLERGWRAVVRTDSYEEIERLDAHLWTFSPSSFLPHGPVSCGDPARMPVLLSISAENTNGAQALFVAGSAEIENADAYERVILLFDGANAEALSAARDSWRGLKAAGRAASYWRQNERGQWNKST